MSQATPIVFVVDDDVSVRESLEPLIRCEGWEAEVFASARQFVARPRPIVPSCLVLGVTLPDLNGPGTAGFFLSFSVNEPFFYQEIDDRSN